MLFEDSTRQEQYILISKSKNRKISARFLLNVRNMRFITNCTIDNSAIIQNDNIRSENTQIKTRYIQTSNESYNESDIF